MRTSAKRPKASKRNPKRRVPSGNGGSDSPGPQPVQETRAPNERRVVLFDLDGTLMDSGNAWRECSRRAINELKKILPDNVDLDVGLAAYRAIYQCHSLIKGKTGPRGQTFEDMRQEWNTRSSYALLIAWANSSDFPPRRGTDPDPSYYATALQQMLKDGERSAELFKRAEDYRDTWYIEYAPYIDRAIEQFWNEDFSRYRYAGVRALMRRLRQNGIEYYIATEGHLPTQWRKIRAIGLQEPDPEDPENRCWITPKQILVTSEAARPHRALQALFSLSEWYRGRAAANREALNVLPPSDSHRTRLRLTAESSEKVAAGLSRMAGLFQRLASKISRDSSGQVQPEFYTRVIYAINQSPDDPRDYLAGPDLSNWDDKTCIHLVMIGDKHPSDIAPVLRLARTIDRKIMAIWVKQGEHGTREPEPGIELEWAECSQIAEAGEEYLLNDRAWSERTQCIVKPPRLFFSAIEPPKEKPKEKLLENIYELLAGIGVVRNYEDQMQSRGRSENIGPSEVILEKAREVVNHLLRLIVTDIRLSDVREAVTNELLDLCRHPLLRNKDVALGHCAGLPRATVELLLAIIEEKEDDNNRMEKYQACIEEMAELLDVNQLDWAAAVIKVLYEESEVVDNQICSSNEMCRSYFDRLIPLIRYPQLPNDFPIRERDWLLGRIVRHLDRSPRESEVASHTESNEEVILGQTAWEKERQQYVFLGTDRNHRQVYCSLNGRKMRNIVCICGSPGSGKSSSLGALVEGSLGGESLRSSSAPKSAVIVFHHKFVGPSEFVELAQRSRVVTKIFAFENELSKVRDEYQSLGQNQIMSLRFWLSQLSDEHIFRWAGLPHAGALARKFSQVRSTLADKESIEELRSAIENASHSFLSRKEKKEILNALMKLDPIIARPGKPAISDEVNPGQLIVIDCGRGSGLSGRLLLWEMALSVLEKHWESERKDEHFLLVFDELHQSLSQNKDAAKQFAKKLGGLGDRMGRHLQVSIVAASQSPKDFKDAGDLWAAATVLLFHDLQVEVRDVPKGTLWQSAKEQFGFSRQAPGEAWYCSKGLNPDYVQVKRRS